MFPPIEQLFKTFNLEPLPELDIFKFDLNMKENNGEVQQTKQAVFIDSESDIDTNSYPQSPILNEIVKNTDDCALSVMKSESGQRRKKLINQEFTKEEDIKLIKLVNIFGKNNWFVIGQMMSTKTGRQCKDRWMHHLNPKGTLNTWTIEEDCQLIELYSIYGPKWQRISEHISGRTSNSIRNRWRVLLRHSKNSFNNQI